MDIFGSIMKQEFANMLTDASGNVVKAGWANRV